VHPSFATKSTLAGHPNNILRSANWQRQRVVIGKFHRIESGRIAICKACRMSSSNGHDTSMLTAAAASGGSASRPSPADRFNIDCEGPAKRALTLWALQQRFQRLNDYYDKAAAEIRASLERAPPR
jgi:hypothetical protein